MKKFIPLALIIVTIGFVIASLLHGSSNENTDVVRPPINDPIDVASNFVSGWVRVQQATITPTVSQYLAESTSLTAEAASAILVRSETVLDIEPITCQVTMPSRVGAKLVFSDESRAEVSIVARGSEKSPRQALVALERTETDWEITSHECIDLSNPDQPEFTFIRTGRLAKDSVPAPYNSDFWHVLYLDGDRVGIVPLSFDETSECINGEGVTVCAPEQFAENTIIEVKGDLTESGANVRQMTLQ